MPSEFDEKVILEEAGRSKLFLNFGALDWFLSNTLTGDIESFYFTKNEAVEGNFPSPDDGIQFSREELVLFDNENRPLK